MKVLVFGNGYIGNEYVQANVFENIVITSADITKIAEIEAAVEKHRPDVIINTAGKTNLEWCRDNKISALMVNTVAPLNLVSVCDKNKIFLVHLSSGCIFAGAGKDGQGFTEADQPNPQCFYAQTKAWGDELITKSGWKNFLIFRLRQPFTDQAHPRNTITKLLSYDKLITSQQSITYIPDLIQATKCLLDKKQVGIFNICNPGTMSPFEIVSLGKDTRGWKKEYQPISKAKLDELDKGNCREHRVDTILNVSKLAAAGCQLPEIKQRIRAALDNYA